MLAVSKRLSESAPNDRPALETVKLQIEFIDYESSEEPDEKTSVENGTALDSNSKKTTKKKKEKFTPCEVCGKLVTSNTIEFHLNEHKDMRPYKCKADDCNKWFTAPVTAQRHYRKVHIKGVTKPFKCDICGKGYVQRSGVVAHRSYHFDPKIPCTICGQFYQNKFALKKHQLVHSDERQYKCNECEKSFQTKFTLRIHMRIHTRGKPFSCAQCTKRFAYKCMMKAHLEKYHADGSR